MTPYQQALQVLQGAYDKASPEALALYSDKIDQAIPGNDIDLMLAVAAALPAFTALVAAFQALSKDAQRPFAARFDDLRMSVDAGAMNALAVEIAAAP